MNRNDWLAWPRINLVGTVDPDMIKTFDDSLRDLHQKDIKPDKILLVLTTTGGSSSYVQGIHERIKLIPQDKEVYCLALGAVYSAGIHILLATAKKNRYTTSNTQFLIHNIQ